MNMFISLIACEIIEQCNLPEISDLFFVKYYRDKCGPCQRMATFLEEVDTRLERNNYDIKFYSVNCSHCDCTKSNVDKAPTLIVKKDNSEVDRLVGHNAFGDLTSFIVKHTGVLKKIFSKRIKSNPGKVVKLNEQDFFTGFDGPWIILFYNSWYDPERSLMADMAKQYAGKISVGEVNGSTYGEIAQKFGAYTLPAIVALYNGLMVSFTRKHDAIEVDNFVQELLKPVLLDIDYAGFEKTKEHLQHGEALFIVFYKDVTVANDTFAKIAHEYKFRANIMKSGDEKLIEEAKIDFSNRNVVLAMYRNGVFFTYNNDFERDKIYEWIFHAHYPYLTKINNENFYAILHGIKPVVILLSQNEEYTELLENISEQLHGGRPFSDQLFASVDVNIYSLFIPTVLPKIKTPTIVILDPSKQQFYSENVIINQSNLRDVVNRHLIRFAEGRLPLYPFKKSILGRICVIVFFLTTIFYIYRAYVKGSTKIQEF